MAHSTALRAPETARKLMEVLPALYLETGSVPPGGGLAATVASLLEVPAVGDHLSAAEAHLTAGDPTSSANHLGRALSLALGRARAPQLFIDRSRSIGIGLSRGPERDMAAAVDQATDLAGRADRWVLELATGLGPGALTRLRAVVGQQLGTGAVPTAYREQEPSLGDAAWALNCGVEIDLPPVGRWTPGTERAGPHAATSPRTGGPENERLAPRQRALPWASSTLRYA